MQVQYAINLTVLTSLCFGFFYVCVFFFCFCFFFNEAKLHACTIILSKSIMYIIGQTCEFACLLKKPISDNSKS